MSFLGNRWQVQLPKHSLLVELNKLVSDEVNRLVKGEPMEDVKIYNFAIARLQGATEISREQLVPQRHTVTFGPGSQPSMCSGKPCGHGSWSYGQRDH